MPSASYTTAAYGIARSDPLAATGAAAAPTSSVGSPKASSFVNGLLDALATELKAEGRIQKLGRGLIGA